MTTFLTGSKELKKIFLIYKKENLIVWINPYHQAIFQEMKRIDKIETNLRQNFGVLEEIQNQINIIDEKLDLINKDFQSGIKVGKKSQVIEKNNAIKSENEQSVNYSNFPSNEKKIDKSKLTTKKKMSEQEIKKNRKCNKITMG